MLKSNGVNTNTRVIELREARQADLTGTIQDYNAISSLLPQESQIYFKGSPPFLLYITKTGKKLSQQDKDGLNILYKLKRIVILFI